MDNFYGMGMIPYRCLKTQDKLLALQKTTPKRSQLSVPGRYTHACPGTVWTKDQMGPREGLACREKALSPQ